MSHRLIFASGPTPRDPSDARTLGWEEREIHRRCDEEPGSFRIYVHRAALPELIALVRMLGRDCTFETFAERQALLLVSP